MKQHLKQILNTLTCCQPDGKKVTGTTLISNQKVFAGEFLFAPIPTQLKVFFSMLLHHGLLEVQMSVIQKHAEQAQIVKVSQNL